MNERREKNVIENRRRRKKRFLFDLKWNTNCRLDLTTKVKKFNYIKE